MEDQDSATRRQWASKLDAVAQALIANEQHAVARERAWEDERRAMLHELHELRAQAQVWETARATWTQENQLPRAEHKELMALQASQHQLHAGLGAGGEEYRGKGLDSREVNEGTDGMATAEVLSSPSRSRWAPHSARFEEVAK